MPNCSSTDFWAVCMGGEGDHTKCLSVEEGVMSKNNTKQGCWIKDKDHDPCMHFSEGGPSPDMVPKTCGDVCCSGGYHVEHN